MTRAGLLLALGALACGGQTSSAPSLSPPGSDVSVWLTSATRRIEAQPGIAFSAVDSRVTPIVVDESRRYQEIEGFGASFTDSAAYLLNEVAPAAVREAVMHDLFTREGRGIGVSFVRNPMGASDLARSLYSYDDLPSGRTDPRLAHFSIAHAEADVIPLVNAARALNPDLRMMANPWSPPG